MSTAQWEAAYGTSARQALGWGLLNHRTGQLHCAHRLAHRHCAMPSTGTPDRRAPGSCSVPGADSLTPILTGSPSGACSHPHWGDGLRGRSRPWRPAQSSRARPWLPSEATPECCSFPNSWRGPVSQGCWGLAPADSPTPFLCRAYSN